MEISRIQPAESESDTLFIVNWRHGYYEQLSAESHTWSIGQMEETIGSSLVAKVTFKLKK